MTEEVVQAQKAGRSKVMLLAAFTLAIGLGIGYGVGGLAEASKGADAALLGAQSLVKEIEAANTKVSELNDTLKAAAGKVKEGKYPSEEIEKLGAVDIPFDGTNLVGKGIGRYNATAVSLLLGYSSAVADVESQTEKLRRLFGAFKPQWEQIEAEAKEPKVHWGLVVADGPKGKWAKMTPLAKPFSVKEWASEVEVGKSKMSVYKKGDPEGSEVIPVDPTTEAGVCPNNIQLRLMGALLDLGSSIVGDSTPGHEVPGVIDQGNKLVDQLKKIGAPAAG